MDPSWNITHNGKLLDVERYMLAPEKIELGRGNLFASEEQRTRILALMLENMGIDAAVRLGPANLWREAVKELCPDL